MASELGIDLNTIITEGVNKAFCLETTDKFPLKTYVPKLMSSFEPDIPKDWNERFDLSFIKNHNFKFSKTGSIRLKNYININLDYDNLIFEDFETGDNIEFKYKDYDLRKLFLVNKRTFKKRNDKVSLFVNDSDSDENPSRYEVSIDSKNGNLIIKTSNNTFAGTEKKITLDQRQNFLSLENGESKIILDGHNVIVKGNLIFENSKKEE